MSGLPARNYSWPPFEVGNFVPVKSGARSPRIVASLSSAVRDAIVEVEPWLGDPRHALALSQLAGAEAVRLLLQDHFERVTIERGADAITPRFIEAKATADRLAAKMAEGVGLTPVGRARLAAITTSTELGQATLSDLLAEGREARIQAEHRQAIDVEVAEMDTALCETNRALTTVNKEGHP